MRHTHLTWITIKRKRWMTTTILIAIHVFLVRLLFRVDKGFKQMQLQKDDKVQ